MGKFLAGKCQQDTASDTSWSRSGCPMRVSMQLGLRKSPRGHQLDIKVVSGSDNAV